MRYLLIFAMLWAGGARPACPTAVGRTGRPDALDKALKTIKKEDVKVHMTHLASDAMEGREAGSKGGHAAALYIAAHFRKCGLKPGGDEGTYFLGVERDGKPGDLKRGKIEDANFLRVEKDSLKIQPLEGSPEGDFDGPIVFAGYGITAPELNYDDYAGVSVKDRIVLVLDHEPQETLETSIFDGAKPTKHSEWSAKVKNAADHGAEAVLIALDPVNHPKDDLPAFEFKWPDEGKETLSLPAAYVSRTEGELIAKLASKNLAAAQKEIDEKLKPASFALLKKATELAISRKGPVDSGMKDVVGVWEGTDPKLKEEYVVIGGHYDHIGMGDFGSKGTRGKVHNGSDDNASGTSAILEIAEALQECEFKRTVILISFDGEEKGLWGSKAFVEEPPAAWPIDKCRAMINMDMLSRNDPKLVNVGMTDKGCDPFLKALAAAETKFKFKFDRKGADDYVKRSDQWNFAEKGVPAIFLFGGMHEDYHKETDDIEKANFAKVELIARTALFIADRMADWTGAWK